MKKCVPSSSTPCSYPIAQCSPMCYDSANQNSCTCADSSYPDNWAGVTCSSPSPTPTPTPSSTCTNAKSVGHCDKCQSSDQCETGYCCPFMKKCVNSGSDPCSYPIA